MTYPTDPFGGDDPTITAALIIASAIDRLGATIASYWRTDVSWDPTHDPDDAALTKALLNFADQTPDPRPQTPDLEGEP